jgi:hypothetical protein
MHAGAAINNLVGLPAIAAVAAIPAASTATAVAAASSATTTSPTAITATAPAATAATLSLRPRFVHHQVSPAEILSVKRVYGLVGVFVVGDFDEGEPTRLTRETVTNQIDTRGSYTHLREPLLKLFLRSGKRKITDIELLHLAHSFCPPPNCKSRSAPKGWRRTRAARKNGATASAGLTLQRSVAWSRKLTPFAMEKVRLTLVVTTTLPNARLS